MQPFTIKVVDRGHPSTSFLSETWLWTDEFYYLKKMAPDLRVLLAGDLATLTDPAKPKGEATRPLAWYHEFEGGRSGSPRSAIKKSITLIRSSKSTCSEGLFGRWRRG